MAQRKQGIGRGEVAARILAAIPANYLLTSLATACLARLLWKGFGVDAANASVAATLFAFALFATVALVAFAVRSVGRLWLCLVALGAVQCIALWLSIEAGGRL